MVYNSAKLLIQNTLNKRENGAITEEAFALWKADMENKLNVFYLMNRITESQYKELSAMLDPELGI